MGDLLYRSYLELEIAVTLTAIQGDLQSWQTEFEAYEFIEYIEIEIGGQIIDKHYNNWIDIWLDLTLKRIKRSMLRNMMTIPAFNNTAVFHRHIQHHIYLYNFGFVGTLTCCTAYCTKISRSKNKY